ncbi:phosphotransferase family protein [Mycobacterium sp. pUA109]|uniref:phosphotransferase family protein n=1 Tax=Mycobacterium sp. pUA109 TaxID=3238982 RepID=UPI00351B90DF
MKGQGVMATGVSVRPRRSPSPRLMSTRPRALASWLIGNGERVCTPVVIGRVGAGQSNVTSIVADGEGRQWVLREPLPGDEAANARAVAREAGTIAALANSGIPVPRIIGIGESRGGGSFFVMQRMAGGVLEDDTQLTDPGRRYQIGVDVIATLARLHRLDPALLRRAISESPSLHRQIGQVSDVWLRVGSGCIHDAGWRAVRSRLIERLPHPQNPAVIMHGDFRLSNLLVCGGRVSAVLDWEHATVGDPLVDLAWLLEDWRSVDDSPLSRYAPAHADGFPTPSKMIEIYRNETGFELDRLSYYRGFTQWRQASLAQAVVMRYRMGSMDDRGVIDCDMLDESIAGLLTSAAVQLKE